MIPVLYIDHIKPAPEGQVVEVGSIVRSRLNNDMVGRVYAIGNQTYTIILIRNGVNAYICASMNLSIEDAELIKCTIKLKQ